MGRREEGKGEEHTLSKHLCLVRTVMGEWTHLLAEPFSNSVHSMPRHLTAVIKARGRHPLLTSGCCVGTMGHGWL